MPAVQIVNGTTASQCQTVDTSAGNSTSAGWNPSASTNSVSGPSRPQMSAMSSGAGFFTPDARASAAADSTGLKAPARNGLMGTGAGFGVGKGITEEEE